MQVYVGQTRSRKLIPRLTALGFGEAVQRQELVPRRFPYFLDNGAFGDWKQGRTFDLLGFQKAVAHAAYLSHYLDQDPDFIVVPDKVASGRDSLEMSLRVLPWLEDRAPGSSFCTAHKDQGERELAKELFAAAERQGRGPEPLHCGCWPEKGEACSSCSPFPICIAGDCDLPRAPGHALCLFHLQDLQTTGARP